MNKLQQASQLAEHTKTNLKNVVHEFEEESQKIIAILYPYVKETLITLEQVRGLFGREIAKAINALLQQADENYDEFIKRCAENELARQVKLMLIKNSDQYKIRFHIKTSKIYDEAE